MSRGEVTPTVKPSSSSIHQLTLAQFEERVPLHGIALLEFTAPWCSACQSFRDVFDELALRHRDIFFGQIDVEEERLIARRFSIEAVPTLAVIHNRALVFRHAGSLSRDALEDLVRQVRELADQDTRSPVSPSGSTSAVT